MCPFTAELVAETVAKVRQQPGVSSAVDFEYIPFGNAYWLTDSCGGVRAPPLCNGSTACLYNASVRTCFSGACGGGAPPSTCFSGAPNCQHGASECRGNRIQACAREHGPATAALELATCMFRDYLESDAERMHPGHKASQLDRATAAELASAAAKLADEEVRDVDGVGRQCAETLGLDWDAIASCVDGSDGDKAERAAFLATPPEHEYVPWLTLNGAYLNASDYASEGGDDEDFTPASLLTALCRALPADSRPSACGAHALEALRAAEVRNRTHTNATAKAPPRHACK